MVPSRFIGAFKFPKELKQKYKVEPPACWVDDLVVTALMHACEKNYWKRTCYILAVSCVVLMLLL